MSKTVLTIKELALRWGISESCVKNYIADGKIIPCKGVPGYKFNIDYIEQLEQCENDDEMSPIERRKLLNKIEQLESENEKYKKAWSQMQIIAIQTSL
jgi:hypothetical protein